MKNPTYLFISASIFLLIVSALFSCSDKSSKNEILASKIQYDVPVSNNDPQLDWWVNNLEGSKRDPFLKRIMEAAEKGDVRVYDYFNKPLTPAQVKYLGTDTVYQTLKRTRPPYEEYDTTIIKSISYRDITKIRFLEEWTWNPKTLEMDKKIMAIGPVMEKEFGTEKFNQLLFWIALDESFPGK